jgi:hypothetical protein
MIKALNLIGVAEPHLHRTVKERDSRGKSQL